MGKEQTSLISRDDEFYQFTNWSALVGADHLFIPLRRAGA